MKIYVQTDIEGVAGFCFRENRANPSEENVRHRYRMYQLLTDEVNAAVRAAFDSGADEVIVNDNHGSGYNILFDSSIRAAALSTGATEAVRTGCRFWIPLSMRWS